MDLTTVLSLGQTALELGLICSLTVLALFLSAAYFAYGSVPLFGEHRMTAFFVFLGMTVGGIALYNAQWQTFFGDAVEPGLRNSVFTFRSRCLFFVGIVVPLLCGNIMTLMPDTEGKLIVLRIFFYAAGVCMLLQALVLRRIPCPPRKAEEKQRKDGKLALTLGWTAGACLTLLLL